MPARKLTEYVTMIQREVSDLPKPSPRGTFMLGRAYRYSRRKFQTWSVTRELARESGYSYTSDYISKNLDNWTRLLEEYRGRPGVRMLEIGSYEGRSAVWFLENVLTHPTAGIVCIDFF